ncbi:YjaG family protein [Aestuariibacter salexigens]|uniref:YjaG family protein n=1 Tax=Aestuariibacter salexigens TaxID=226010 RepID=UPI0004110240|nr:YjaG family protein [Aestuariibacter salexigens]
MKNRLTIFQQVRELQDWRAVAFCATLLERMLPNYALFCDITDTGDAKCLRTCTDLVWEWLHTPGAKINLPVQLEKVELAIPDASDHDTFGVYPAIDTGMSMSATLLLLQGEDPQGAVVVSKLSQGSVEAFIEFSAEGELSDADVKSHPLMQWEIAFQSELLNSLKDMRREKASILSLKAMATAEKMSNIGLEME